MQKKEPVCQISELDQVIWSVFKASQQTSWHKFDSLKKCVNEFQILIKCSNSNLVSIRWPTDHFASSVARNEFFFLAGPTLGPDYFC